MRRPQASARTPIATVRTWLLILSVTKSSSVISSVFLTIYESVRVQARFARLLDRIWESVGAVPIITILKNSIFEHLARAEPHDCPRLDLGRRAGLRISPHTRLTVGLDCTTEARNDEFPSSLLCFLHCELV